jgi:hypothetical protein
MLDANVNVKLPAEVGELAKKVYTDGVKKLFARSPESVWMQLKP